MKILITGPNGYIAGRLSGALTRAGHDVTAISVRGEEWRGKPFGGFDTLIHTAAAVHDKRAAPGLCKAVNTGLTLELAQKAKDGGVKQFIFFSTMAVYGPEHTVITPDTPCRPVTPYGVSKWEAERGLEALAGEHFTVCVLRPPMVYGPDCPGNYRALRSVALRSPFVPRLENRRGTVYVEHLCELTRLLAEHRAGGVFFPQDAPASTSDMMAWIRESHGLTARGSRLLGALVNIGARLLPPLKKAFGSLEYRPDMTACAYGEYRQLSCRQAVTATEKQWGV